MSNIRFVAIMAAATVCISFTTASVTSVLRSFDASANTNMAVYWGQGPNQKRLSHFCADSNIDIIPIGFMNIFPDQSGGYPGTNFGNQCGSGTYKNPDGSTSPLLDNCPNIGPDIKICQQMGKKILLSLGGAIPSTQHLNSDASATNFANFLWRAFGPDKELTGSTFPRPFGDAAVDGFDFDIESVLVNGEKSGDLSRSYATMINTLRAHYAAETKKYYISGAPQCIVPDAHLANAIENSWFDFLFVQFYNTPACSARAYFDHTYGAYGGPATNISFDAWVSFVHAHAAKGSKPRVYLGLPAAPNTNVVYDTKMYLQPTEAQTIIDAFQCKYPNDFGGVMIFEATYSENYPVNGMPYADALKGYLMKNSCAKKPATPLASKALKPLISESLPPIIPIALSTDGSIPSSGSMPPYPIGTGKSYPAPSGSLSIVNSAPSASGSLYRPSSFPSRSCNSSSHPFRTGTAFHPSNSGTAPYPIGTGTAPRIVGSGTAPYPIKSGTGPIPIGTGTAPYPIKSGTAPIGTGTAPRIFGSGTAPYPIKSGTAPYPIGTGTAPRIFGYGTAPYPIKSGTAPTGTGAAPSIIGSGTAPYPIKSVTTPSAIGTGTAPRIVNSGTAPPSIGTGTASSSNSGTSGSASESNASNSPSGSPNLPAQSKAPYSNSSVPLSSVSQPIPAVSIASSVPEKAVPLSSTQEFMTTDIVTSYVKTCPVTQTITTGGSQIIQTGYTVSTVYSTITSTICTACLAPPTPAPTAARGSNSPAGGKGQEQASSTQEVVTTVIVYTTLTTCPVTTTITSQGQAIVQTTSTVSTITTTSTSTICTKCIPPATAIAPIAAGNSAPAATAPATAPSSPSSSPSAAGTSPPSTGHAANSPFEANHGSPPAQPNALASENAHYAAPGGSLPPTQPTAPASANSPPAAPGTSPPASKNSNNSPAAAALAPSSVATSAEIVTLTLVPLPLYSTETARLSASGVPFAGNSNNSSVIASPTGAGSVGASASAGGSGAGNAKVVESFRGAAGRVGGGWAGVVGVVVVGGVLIV